LRKILQQATCKVNHDQEKKQNKIGDVETLNKKWGATSELTTIRYFIRFSVLNPGSWSTDVPKTLGLTLTKDYT